MGRFNYNIVDAMVLTTKAKTNTRTRSPISGEMSSANCCTVDRNRFNLFSWFTAPPVEAVLSSELAPFPVEEPSPVDAAGDDLPSVTAEDADGCARSIGGVLLPLRRPLVEESGSAAGTLVADDEVVWLDCSVIAEGDIGD
jgi:hypothetical protein